MPLENENLHTHRVWGKQISLVTCVIFSIVNPVGDNPDKIHTCVNIYKQILLYL
jgi:hypothetical protein